MAAAAISKHELFARLAEGHAARITVVTPNRRLARALAREFDGFQIAKGLAVWEDADILPVGAFLERLWEDALYSEIATGVPQLLAPAQERELWEAAIGESEWEGQLLDPAQAAAQAMDAWRLAHAWRLEGALGKFPGNEDTRAFAEWARAYAKRTAREGCSDGARLADIVAELLKESALRKPRVFVAFGFDILPPQTKEFFDACEANAIEINSCQPEKRESKPVRASFTSAREELEAAARWARARLEGGARRIGVVVPDLEQRRKEVIRVFSRAMQPGYNLPGTPRKEMPFNVSLGAPLADYPVAHAALSILALASHEVGWPLASRLVRSPFLGGAESEMAARARLDARLREKLSARLTLAKLIGEVAGCPLLRQALEALFARAKEIAAGSHSPHDWARHFTSLLEAAGFPGERALDPEEFQARAKLNALLAELAKFERVAPRMDGRAALSRLERLAAETLFQPESAEVPIQALGVLESAGLEFDCLWVSGLTDDAWPLRARPNPFIPIALQKKAGIPEAAAESSLALDKRITEGWIGAAPEVVLSHPRMEEDRELAASPLISTLPIGRVGLPDAPRTRDLIFAARQLESVPDGAGPPLPPAGEGRGVRVRGGTRVLADHAACPFRAFARHRLGAEGLEAPAEGPDALTRGQLLHTLMARLWNELKTSAALKTDTGPAIERAAAAAVAEANLEGRFAELDRQRLARLAREWLQIESKRPEFEVVATEQPREMEVGGLTLSGRIDRMDRLTQGEAAGSHLVIDYKTGSRLTPRMWMGERPDEPQLPLYATAAKEEIGAVAFARLRRGEMRLMGYARAPGAVPGLTRYDNWQDLLSGWKTTLESLAQGFAKGDARVDPKEGLKTCRNCDLHPLCRVHERLSALEGDEDEEGE